MKHIYPDTTLLITHYNRSQSLQRLLTAFRELDCHFGGIVVSDDKSKPEHLQKLRELQQEFGFELVTTPVNKSLGSNINRGQDAVKTPFTLYVQEDFLPSDQFPVHFEDALGFMRADTTWDLIRFYAYFAHPTMKPYQKGFSEMVFSYLGKSHLKFYVYSDHPHLRRSNFFEKFGRYAEIRNINQSEFRMALSFIKNGGRALLFDEFTTLFDQKNTQAEPSTANRPSWRLSPNPLIRLMRQFYLQFRWVKNTLQLAFLKN